MDNSNMTYRIVYFSGTGGTRRAAELFERALLSRDLQVVKSELSVANSDQIVESKTSVNINTAAIAAADSAAPSPETLVLFFPVYSFNEPTPVAEWVERLPTDLSPQNKKQAVVISISGGGDIPSNSACRARVIRKLEKKGYDVFYEYMLPMPNNAISAYDIYLSARLLQVLPENIEAIAEEIVAGKRRRVSPQLFGKILAPIANMEKKFEKSFGRNLQTNDNCNGCGWCAENCPRGNIVMQNDRPVFDSKCVICLRCVYGCPRHAIVPKLGKSLVIKEGFDLHLIEMAMREEPEITATCTVPGGSAFAGIRKYLGVE